MSAVTYRPVLPTELEALSVLASHVYTMTFGDGLSAAALADILESTRSPQSFARYLAEGQNVLVACDQRDILGYVQIGDCPAEAKGYIAGDQAVNALYVHPRAQGRGIGRGLLSAGLTLPRCQAAQAVFLTVWEENKPALTLYLKAGFCRVGVVPVIADGQPVGEDLLLRKPMEETR